MKLRLALAGLGTSALVVLTGCGNGPPPTDTSASGSAASGGDAMALVTSGTPVTTVNATDQLKFDPGSASAKVGDVVKFDNTGSVGHNVTFDAGPKSDTFTGGSSVLFKFTKAGTYTFHCTIHPGMDGTVTVS